MIELKIYTPKGIEHEEKYDSIVVYDQHSGSFGVLSGHIPVISTISNGYVCVKTGESEKFIAVKGAVFKMQNDEASIVSEEIAIGESSEDAMNKLKESYLRRLNENKERNVELALAENELKKQIKKSKAGHI
ncbi:hypothetical protein J6Y73_05805 [bacterium]|nr:hypothetical protein [bacterium]